MVSTEVFAWVSLLALVFTLLALTPFVKKKLRMSIGGTLLFVASVTLFEYVEPTLYRFAEQLPWSIDSFLTSNGINSQQAAAFLVQNKIPLIAIAIVLVILALILSVTSSKRR